MSSGDRRPPDRELSIAVVEGDRAVAQLADPEFLSRWRELYERCAWSTGFQTAAFAAAWYDAYRPAFTPLLITGTTPDGVLGGLIACARDKRGQLVVAGGRQAEYQGWIALPEYAESFPPMALTAMRPMAAQGTLTFQYLPPGTPLEWTAGDRFRDLCLVESIGRPLLRVSDEDKRGESLKKKSNKSRLNRLARLGELKFERLTNAEELADVFGDIAVLYDLRQGGFDGDLPFRSDPAKAGFHLALMKAPGLVHATVLRLGGSVLAAHVGVASRTAVHLGILAHSPVYAQHSPGKLHLLFLAQQLAADGIDTFDLTPGGNWKDRFASDHDSVARLTVFASRSAAIKSEMVARTAGVARRLLKTARIEPAAIKAVLARASRRPMRAVTSVLRQSKSKLYHQAELRAYTMNRDRVPTSAEPGSASRDALADLLEFVEAPGTPSRAVFFRTANARLEAGHHVYTRVQNGRLVHWGWLAENQEKGFMDEVHQELVYPPGSTVLYDFYTLPDQRGRGLYASTLRQMMGDAAALDTQALFIFVLADNAPSRRVIEKAGFAYAFSLFERILVARPKRWRAPDA